MKEGLGERSVFATVGGTAQELDLVLPVPERLVLGRVSGSLGTPLDCRPRARVLVSVLF